MTTLERPEIRQTSLLGQSLAIARRNFVHIKRMPEMLELGEPCLKTWKH